MVVDFTLPGRSVVAGTARSSAGNKLHWSKWASCLWTQVGRVWLPLKLCHGTPVLRGPQFGKRWHLVYKCWSPLGWKWNPSAVICPGIPAGTYVTLSRYVLCNTTEEMMFRSAVGHWGRFRMLGSTQSSSRQLTTGRRDLGCCLQITNMKKFATKICKNDPFFFFAIFWPCLAVYLHVPHRETIVMLIY